MDSLLVRIVSGSRKEGPGYGTSTDTGTRVHIMITLYIHVSGVIYFIFSSHI